MYTYMILLMGGGAVNRRADSHKGVENSDDTEVVGA